MLRCVPQPQRGCRERSCSVPMFAEKSRAVYHLMPSKASSVPVFEVVGGTGVRLSRRRGYEPGTKPRFSRHAGAERGTAGRVFRHDARTGSTGDGVSRHDARTGGTGDGVSRRGTTARGTEHGFSRQPALPVVQDRRFPGTLTPHPERSRPTRRAILSATNQGGSAWAAASRTSSLTWATCS